MSIRMMVGEEKKGLPGIYEITYGTDPRPIYMEETFKGLVVRTYEMNGYDDSDFYAVVYIPETDSFKHLSYATTRGWTYPNSADVDAPPELIQKYREREEQAFREVQKARRRKAFHGLDLSEGWLQKLETLPEDQRQAVASLLKVKTFRSEFRKSLRTQLESWLNGESIFESPFSFRQWEVLTRYNRPVYRQYA